MFGVVMAMREERFAAVIPEIPDEETCSTRNYISCGFA